MPAMSRVACKCGWTGFSSCSGLLTLNPLRCANRGVFQARAAASEAGRRLFVTTVDEHFVGDNADLAKHRVTKMASALRSFLTGLHDAVHGFTMSTPTSAKSSTFLVATVAP